MKRLDERVLSIWDLDGLYVDNISNVLGSLVPSGAEDAKLNFTINFGDVEVSIVYKREETPKEETERKEREKRRKATLAKSAERIKQKELRELERLRKKYESI